MAHGHVWCLLGEALPPSPLLTQTCWSEWLNDPPGLPFFSQKATHVRASSPSLVYSRGLREVQGRACPQLPLPLSVRWRLLPEVTELNLT